MRTLLLLTVTALCTAGCTPNEDAVPGNSNENRPGASQEDTGTDRSPAGSGSENAAPPIRPTPRNPSTPGTPPH